MNSVVLLSMIRRLRREMRVEYKRVARQCKVRPNDPQFAWLAGMDRYDMAVKHMLRMFHKQNAGRQP